MFVYIILSLRAQMYIYIYTAGSSADLGILRRKSLSPMTSKIIPEVQVIKNGEIGSNLCRSCAIRLLSRA